jgi:serine/threonine protein kinase/lipopolysaccharide biosynthesis regulator YciM
MAPTSTCPGDTALRRLALGQLADDEAAPLEEHLARCDRCAEALQALQTADSLVRGLREARAAAPLPEQARIEGLARRLQELRPETSPGPEGPPARLGEYRILREVGRGGMGVVYEAVQESLGRHVALKVLPPHALLSAEHRERFRREARAAALLHHSNIVPVFGTGEDRGVHFYAMQFIHGQGLDRVLRELRGARGEGAAASPEAPGQPAPGPDLTAGLTQGLRTGRFPGGPSGAAAAPPSPAGPTVSAAAGAATPRSGLAGSREGEYFRGVARVGVQVAEALAYAHRQGILHRDIKPANLLLDAQGTVWVTDFGLAKAEGADELTHPGDIVGTLRYLAPERFDGVSDPRGDVYGLGATLYELLTLRPAFDEPERARLIERVTRGDLARPRQLDGRIPRDLETVVLKALAREPAERYPSAEALAEDLRRFLLDRPIRARRAGLAERTWRWCRRNPVVAGLLAAAVVLAAGLGVLALLLWDRQQQTAAALRRAVAQTERAEKAEGETKEQAEITQAVNDFLQYSLLGQADTANQPLRIAGLQTGRNPKITVRELLDRAAGQIEERFAHQEAVEAAIRLTIGNTYQALGEYAEAQKHVERSVRLRTARLGADHPDTLTSKAVLANLYHHQGKYDRAGLLYQEVIGAQAARLGADHPDTLASKNDLAALYKAQGKYDRAEALFQAVIAAQAARLGADHPDTLTTKGNLAALYQDQERYDRAEVLYQEVLDARAARLGADHPNTLSSKNNLALLYQDQQKYDRAEALYREVLAARTAQLGAGHASTLNSQNNLALLYHYQRKYDRAEALYREVLAARTARLGPGHPDTAASKHNLARLYQDQGKLDRAEPLFNEAIAARTAWLGDDHPDTLLSKGSLAVLYRTQGKYDRAEALFREVIAARAARQEADRPEALVTKKNLAAMYQALGKYDRAEALYQEVLTAQAARLGADHPETLNGKNTLAVLYWRMGRFGQSVPLFEELLRVRRKQAGDEHPETLRTAFNLAVNYRDAGRPRDAAAVLDEWLPRGRARLGPGDPVTQFGVQTALTVYERAGTPARSEPLLRDLADLARRQAGADSGAYAGQLALLGSNLLQQRKGADAEAVLRECLAIRRKREPEAWTTFNSLSALGDALLLQRKHADAEPLLREGYEGLKQREAMIPAQGKARLAEALHRLVQLYDAWGKPDEAARWRKKLDAAKDNKRSGDAKEP